MLIRSLEYAENTFISQGIWVANHCLDSACRVISTAWYIEGNSSPPVRVTVSIEVDGESSVLIETDWIGMRYSLWEHEYCGNSTRFFRVPQKVYIWKLVCIVFHVSLKSLIKYVLPYISSALHSLTGYIYCLMYMYTLYKCTAPLIS
jgi:hypothetical protein